MVGGLTIFYFPVRVSVGVPRGAEAAKTHVQGSVSVVVSALRAHTGCVFPECQLYSVVKQG